MTIPTREIRNLSAFARLFGYIRHFHPSDEASKIDWYKFAAHGTELTRDAGNSEELKAILEELFLPIAPTIQIYHTGERPRPVVLPQETTGLKLVAWQHQGVGLGSVDSDIFRSIRVNCENRIPPRGNMYGTVYQYDAVRRNRLPAEGTVSGSAYQHVDGTGCRGREIRLRASVRTEVSSTGNLAQLWLLVQGQNSRPRSFTDRRIDSCDRQSYEVTDTAADDATRIVFGCSLTGSGRVWVDEFELLARNSSGEWETIEIQNPGFEEDLDSQPGGWDTPSDGYSYRRSNDSPYEGQRSLLIEDSGVP